MSKFILDGRGIGDISGDLLYEYFFNKIPSGYYFERIKFAECLTYLKQNMEFLFQSKYHNPKSTLKPSDIYESFILGDNGEFESTGYADNNEVFLFKKDNRIARLNRYGDNVYLTLFCDDIVTLEKFAKEFFLLVNEIEESSEIGLLIERNGGVSIKKIPLDVPEIDIQTNYGVDFYKNKHEKIIKKLSEEKSGLYLFHGEPGSGKTHYIKYLSKLVNRLFVFVPVNMVESLISPSLISTLVNHKNIVLVLEDAEKSVVSREQNSNESLVSVILNLSDGIIGSLFNCSIIVSFNTAKEKIDKALYRKGRLKIEHSFGTLDINESQNLLDKLGKNIKAAKPMTLAEIYNSESENFHKEKETPKMGF